MSLQEATQYDLVVGEVEQPVPTIFDTRPSLDIVRGGERARRWERVPLEFVITETPVIDPEHASELAADIKRDQQLMPVLLRATEIDGQLAYQIADGFHRSAGMKAAGLESIEAIVMYGWSYKELLNKRILSANSVKSVKFGRLAMWMEELYELTPWSEMGISLSDAVTATVFGSEQVGEKNIGRHETAKLREWVQGQARNWQMPLGELWSSLGIIEQSDPRLVHLVRPKLEKGDETSFILEGHLKAASEAFPGKENYPIQRALINWVLTVKASPQLVERMAEDILPYVTASMKAREASEIIARIERGWEMERQQKLDEREKRRRQAEEREAQFDDESPRSESRPTQERKPSQRGIVEQQRKELEQLKWWETTTGLEDKERNLVRLVLGEAKSLQSVAEMLAVDKDEVAKGIITALDRRDLQS